MLNWYECHRGEKALMTIPELFGRVFFNGLIALFISLLLTACNSGENYTGSTGGVTDTAGGVTDTAGGGEVQGIVQDVTLAWVAPVEREDGTPISMAEIAGYRVYYGTSQGNFTNEIDIADSNTMQVTLNSLVSGTYYLVVTTYDIDGRESALSEVVTISV